MWYTTTRGIGGKQTHRSWQGVLDYVRRNPNQSGKVYKKSREFGYRLCCEFRNGETS